MAPRNYDDDDDNSYRSGNTQSGKGRQGFASMSEDRIRAIGIKGRAQRFGRSEEEESDYEESHRNGDNGNNYQKKSSQQDGRRNNGYNGGKNSKSQNYQQDSDEEDSKEHQPISNRRKGHSGDRRKHGGFAANPELGIEARAKRFGRSYEEESDIEEENRKNGTTNHGYGKSNNRGNQSNQGSNKSQRRSNDYDDDNEEEDDDNSYNRSDNRSNNRSNNQSNNRSNNRSQSSGKGKQGFASMPKEKVRAIASKGGRTLHAGEEPTGESHYDSDENDEDNDSNNRSYNKSNRSNKQSSNRSRRDQDDDDDDDDEDDDDDSRSYNRGGNRSQSSGKGKQGFASMPKEKVRAIASKGGRTINAGEGPTGKKRYRNDENDDDEEESSGDDSNNYNRSDRRSNNRSDNRSSNGRGSGKQGFASMPKEKVRAIASKGGRSSGGSNKRSRNDDHEY